MLKERDYSRLDDYDPEGANWMDVTTVGHTYEQEIDMNKAGHARHRAAGAFGPWVQGYAPRVRK